MSETTDLVEREADVLVSVMLTAATETVPPDGIEGGALHRPLEMTEL